MRNLTATQLKEMKTKSEKIPLVTAYDYPTAKIADEVGIPAILVGDSLGMVVLGYESTIQVTLEDMIHHTRAVARGASHAHVVADMPFMTFGVRPYETLRNAGRIIQEGNAQSVKLEGGEHIAEEVRRIVEVGIPVMGHIGLTPQSIHRFGGYKVQGKVKEEADRLLRDAAALQDAGAYAVVLELVPVELSKMITERLKIPTIGIGAGPYCDGQIQVIHDILGLFSAFVPRHTKQYTVLNDVIGDALRQYISEVQEGSFPREKHSFNMDGAIAADLLNTMDSA